MNVMYHIFGLCPRTDINMGRCGFGIKLYPHWKDAVEKSAITQKNINSAIESYHRAWLDGCGYDTMFDPEAGPLSERKGTKPGLNARPLYDIHSIRVAWGEWGPEHIAVPGNACGLDISRGGLGAPMGGAVLEPHNIDSLAQQVLLLTVFTTIADHIILDIELQEMKTK